MIMVWDVKTGYVSFSSSSGLIGAYPSIFLARASVLEHMSTLTERRICGSRSSS